MYRANAYIKPELQRVSFQFSICAQNSNHVFVYTVVNNVLSNLYNVAHYRLRSVALRSHRQQKTSGTIAGFAM